VPHAD